ncbi:hypothetical protein L2E82_05996 [Cichorium intybus]|uniref:Uncharacterized protein n=1 Tax=Cichorium intybus TaxID=13427 RepID=A0ACB9H9C7_CICIN|nr:hypothetical protein L2E82_05996 [Cichorium intybus]
MGEDFGEIQPEDQLKFIFVPKKQISCVVKLINKSNRYMAFKIKTTRPNLYCVRPNNGIMKPDSTCEVNIIRQACKVLPLSDVIDKEKFLIQRMFVSEDTTLEEATSIFCSNDDCSDINEKKLKVVLDIIPKVEEMKSKTKEVDLQLHDAMEAIEMKSKLKELNLRLTEAEETISKLKEQKSECGCKGKKKRPGVFIKCFNVKFV